MKMQLVLGAFVLLSVTGVAEVTSLLDRSTKVDPKKAAPADPPVMGPQEMNVHIAGFDVYGGGSLNAVSLKQHFGAEIDQWFRLGLAADPSVLALEKRLADAIQKKYDLAFAQWSIVQHLEPSNLAIYVTLDVVEKKDAGVRLNFTAAPKVSLADPGGLIAQWEEYQKIAMGLVEIGEIQLDAVDCEALHCPFGHKHPKLQKYEKIFLDGAKKHAVALSEVVVKESRPESRASAAFLLAYSKDGKRVVDGLLGGVADPEDIVRNNVMRVLGDIAEYHSEFLIPIKPVAAALNFPRVSDRSKAINVVYFLAMGSAQARQYLMENKLGTLVSLMGSIQPDHRLAAHAILRKLSGKNYAATDLQAWANWSKRIASGNRGVALRQ